MNDLTAFLAARLDEDEAAAKTWPSVRPQMTIHDQLTIHGPARVLREVEAKQAILDAYVHADGDSPRDRDRGRWDALHAAVRSLAVIWSDHPDYRQEWKP